MTREEAQANNSRRAEILKEKERWGIDEAIYEAAQSRGKQKVYPEEIKSDIDERLLKVIASLM